MASVCTEPVSNLPVSSSQQTTAQQHRDKCSNINSNNCKGTVEVATSSSRHRSVNYAKARVVQRSPNKRHLSTSNILMPPPGTCPRIPPFPGVAPPPPGIFFPTMPPPPQIPNQPLFLTLPPPVYQQPQSMIYQPISESNGYRLMINMPVGHREDGTYGILTCGVRPDQEYRYYTYYVNSVTYYNLPSDVITCSIATTQAI